MHTSDEDFIVDEGEKYVTPNKKLDIFSNNLYLINMDARNVTKKMKLRLEKKVHKSFFAKHLGSKVHAENEKIIATNDLNEPSPAR